MDTAAAATSSCNMAPIAGDNSTVAQNYQSARIN